MEPSTHSEAKLHPDDFGNNIVLPEIAEQLNSYIDFEGEDPSYKDEVSHLDKMKSQLLTGRAAGESTDMKFWGLKHRRGFDNYRRWSAEAKVKNIGLYQKYPDNDVTKKGLLHTLRSHVNGGIPYSSLFSDENGKFKINFESSLATSDMDGVEFDPNRYPTFTPDKKGQFTYQRLGAADSSFFKNEDEVAAAAGPYFEHFADLTNTSIPELVKKHNMYEEDESKHLDPEMDFRVVSGDPTSEGYPLIIEMMEPGVISLDPFNYMFRPQVPAGTKGPDPIGANEEGFKYWKETLFNNNLDPSPRLIKSTLISKITPLLLKEGGLSEEERESISMLAGAAARFSNRLDDDGKPLNHGIATDKTGRAILDGFGSFDSLDTVNSFLDSQYELLVKTTLTESDYTKEAEDVTDRINRTLQHMMVNRDQSRSKGIPIEKGGLLGGATAGDVMRKVALSEDLSNLMGGVAGLGAQGSTPEELDLVCNLLAQLFETQNRAALQGYDIAPYSELSKPSYVDNEGKEFVFNYRKRTGKGSVLDVSSDFFKEMGYSKKDPVYNMVRELAQKGSRYAVLHGLNGDRVTPLIKYLGLGLEDENENGIDVPLRISKIYIKDSDVEVNRKLAEIDDIKIFGKPLKHYIVKGGSNTPIDIDEEQLTEKGADLAAASSNPKLDKNKDGIVTSEERKQK